MMLEFLNHDKLSCAFVRTWQLNDLEFVELLKFLNMKIVWCSW